MYLGSEITYLGSEVNIVRFKGQQILVQGLTYLTSEVKIFKFRVQRLKFLRSMTECCLEVIRKRMLSQDSYYPIKMYYGLIIIVFASVFIR